MKQNMDFVITVAPQYVAAMKSRKKHFELRTRIPVDLSRGDHIYVVEARTGGEVMLLLRVREVLCNTPDDMYRRCGYGMSISRADYDKYVEGRTKVFAIAFEVEEQGCPLMHISDLGLKKAPQWFTRVTRKNSI